MKKITFKNLLALLLCTITFQTYAQVGFQEGVGYRLRTAVASPDSYNTGEGKVPPFVDQFVYATVRPGQNSLNLTLKNTEDSSLQLFAFVALTGQMIEYPADSGEMRQVYNIVSSTTGDGSNGTGVLELNELGQASSRTRIRGNAFPFDNDLGKFIVVPASSNENETFYQIVASGTVGADSQPNRAIMPDTNYEWLNFHTVGLGNEARPQIEQWVLENVDGVNVLSNNQFDTSSIFIANPVNNELSIKGISDTVNEISVFSLLGQKVLTRIVKSQSTLNIDVSGLVSGVYLVKLKGDNGAFTKKIIKN